MPKLTATNHEKAALLRSIADYVEVSDTPARVRIGLDFTVLGQKIRLVSQPVEFAGVEISKVAADSVISHVEAYRAATGNPDAGADIEQAMNNWKQGLTDSGL